MGLYYHWAGWETTQQLMVKFVNRTEVSHEVRRYRDRRRFRRVHHRQPPVRRPGTLGAAPGGRPGLSRVEHLPDDLKLGNNVWLSAYGPHNWGYTAQLTPEQTELTIPRGKATGGSSAVNGQVLYRGIPEDYDRWAEWGNDEWGFTRVLPYFNRLETDLDFGGDDFHGSTGPVPVRRSPRSEWMPHALAFEEACVAEGYPISEDQNHPESTGVSPRGAQHHRRR